VLGDVHVRPLIKKSHVIYSKFYPRLKRSGAVGVGVAWTRLIWLRIGTHCAWPPVTVTICGQIFLCLYRSFIICDLQNPCLGLFAILDKLCCCNLLNVVFL
jgi:hypothetical protein